MTAEEYLVERTKSLENELYNLNAKLDAAKGLIGEAITSIVVETDANGARTLRFRVPTYVPSTYEESDPLGFKKRMEAANALGLLVYETEKEG